MQTRPTLLHGCASAATAAEADFRIDAPVEVRRQALVIALDRGAADVTAEIAALLWQGARFVTCDDIDISGNGSHPHTVVRAGDGTQLRLADALVGVDVAVMVATADDCAALAAAIGEVCGERRIMTAGVVIDTDRQLSRAVTALRPHAQVLLVSSDADDVVEVLTALRA